MRYIELFRKLLVGLRDVFRSGKRELQPRDILNKIIQEMERRKKFGIEEKAYVPNSYQIYLSMYDYEEISPLLSGVKEQLKNRLMDRIKKKEYKLLSLSLVLDIRGDSELLKDQVIIESSFLKEKTPVGVMSPENLELRQKGPIKKEDLSLSPQQSENNGYGARSDKLHVDNMKPINQERNTSAFDKTNISPAVLHREGGTRIIEDVKTKFMNNILVNLEVIKGDGLGDVIKLKGGEYTFGRGNNAQISLVDSEETISRQHFKLIVRDDRIRIKDLGSLNGTRVNDLEIEEAELQKGDLISIGKMQLKVA